VTTQVAKAPTEQKIHRSDARLVRECLKGNEDAWSTLIDKYKNLIFSIPIKYGFSTDEAAEIFQGVCLELLRDLPTLREPRALPKWLIQVTSHKCSHRKQQEQRWVSGGEADAKFASLFTAPENTEKALREAEREQMLRQALSALSPRCQQLIHMLFFEFPARPYQEIAECLGLATGSIGFIRGRCLERLRRQLEKAGLR
jgi:RNA polymerase sigma factor (sigma-70 family)